MSGDEIEFLMDNGESDTQGENVGNRTETPGNHDIPATTNRAPIQGIY